MNNLRELYQDIIIDHGRSPRNFGFLEHANQHREGFNPLCGDKIHLHLIIQGNHISQMKFEGVGCALSIASASLMIDQLNGKTFQEVQELFELFHKLLTKQTEACSDKLGKLAVFSGVNEFPARVKCVTLAWHTLMSAMNNQAEVVTTEKGYEFS